jgi:hypothetical protein
MTRKLVVCAIAFPFLFIFLSACNSSKLPSERPESLVAIVGSVGDMELERTDVFVVPSSCNGIEVAMDLEATADDASLAYLIKQKDELSSEFGNFMTYDENNEEFWALLPEEVHMVPAGEYVLEIKASDTDYDVALFCTG